jgi:succinyl-CoA synthetase alpha subunit
MSILIDQDTTFIIQGITGREAVNLTRECLDYGSKIVGGVTPGRKGREVHGVPVFDTVEQVVEHNGGVVPDGSVVTVPPAGTRDAVFEADEQTEAIVIYTEPGGRMEAQLAQWVKEHDSRLPIIAFMAGKFMDDEEMQGMSFGHAGTIVEGKEDSATEKIARLEAAGIPVVQRIDEIPDLVKAKIAERSA